MSNKGKVIIFTDLDGTILNDEYQYGEIEPTIQQLLSLKVSIVFASSKTRREIDFYRKRLEIIDPYIVENGSAIIIPNNYFQFNYKFTKQIQGYNVIQLGVSYKIIREKLSIIKNQTNSEIVGFGDMNVEELVKDSGLPLYLSKLAKEREYSEPFKIIKGNEPDIIRAISNEGLCSIKGGRYFHLTGNCDKGKATLILKDLFLKQYGKIFTIGIGDSDNDLTMLKNVDVPFYVGKAAERVTLWKNILEHAESSK